MVAEGAVGASAAAGAEAAWPPEETLRVMIATDVHLGHAESDVERGEDSFTAFEEVLELCVRYDADMLVLGGDLFHTAKPSPACLQRATQLLRRYCLGERPVAIELLSDPQAAFGRPVNYEDPNMNVSCPVFSIHGNHDDPVGVDAVCSLDVLATLGLVNYWGKWTDYTRVRMSPVLLRKADARLALYGLGYLKDQRLSRLFQEKKVEMELPEDSGDWLNMLVLHQNRADRGPGNYIPEKVLPRFLDLVVWGHEHDSEVYAMRGRTGDGPSVLQPGSTVATSLAAGEALPKHAALLQVHGKDYTVTPIPLKTVRPFIFKTIVLSEEELGEERLNEHEQVQEFLRARVQDAVAEAARGRSGDARQPALPLVRLNVVYERETQNFNRARFGQELVGLVANPKDVLNMKRERRARERKPAVDDEGPQLAGAALAADVEELLRQYFQELPFERRPHVLSVRALTDSVREFTVKRDDEVFRRTLEAHKRRAVDLLLREEDADDTDEGLAVRLATIKRQLDAADAPELRKLLDAAGAQPPTPGSLKRAVVVLSSDDEADAEVAPRGGRGRGARGGRGRPAATPRAPRSRAKAEPKPEPEPAARTPPERRTPRRSAAAKSAAWLSAFSENARAKTYEIDDSD